MAEATTRRACQRTPGLIVRRRLNITLPEETLRLLDRIATKGDRSRLIAEAVNVFVQTKGRAHLRKQLREGASRRADRDRQIAADWFAIDEEAWQQPGEDPRDAGRCLSSTSIARQGPRSGRRVLP